VKPQAPPPRDKGLGKLEARLAEVHPDTLTPRDALDLVYALKDMIDE
jgi:DNA mismatch repair protein MutS